MISARGVVASSTGNHGAAAAAHATAVGLPAAIFCHPEASVAAMQMIAAYGGLIAQFDPEQQHDALVAMVDDGWFPATSMDPLVSGRCNPYGAEGYKSIAYEIVAELGDTPDAIIVPTASGDTLYGVAKGFAEVSEVTGMSATRIVAAQPETADPLRRSMQRGAFTRATGARSFALSVADAASGRHAMTALNRWNGETVSVSEDHIRDATWAFARSGLLVEPASAVSLAGSRQLLADGRIDDDARIVLLATCAGIKWPRELATMFPVRPLRDADQLRSQIENPR
jgi:threonine synthase